MTRPQSRWDKSARGEFVNFHVGAELKRWLRTYAKENDLSISQVMRRAAQQFQQDSEHKR